MYKELKKQIADKNVIHEIRLGIENRIRFKIDNQLGLKGMSFQEVKIEMTTNHVDRFAKVFADIEELDKQREELLKEYLEVCIYGERLNKKLRKQKIIVWLE